MNSKNAIAFAFFLGLLFVSGSVVMATSVDRMSLVNLEGYPGKTTKMEISLEGTDPGERSGFWYSYYRQTEGDNANMDISSWITVEPENFTIKQGEVKTFTVKVKVPRDAELGLWGATSEEAGKEGHSSERRTYIVFKDAPAEGNVYSGLLIPVSVKVLESQSFVEPIINFVLENIIVIVLVFFIVILLVKLKLRRKQ